MRLSINFNSKNSYNDLNLNMETPIIPSPEKNVNFIEIEGRDGTLTEDIGTYKDIPIPIKFSLVDRSNIKESCRQIKAWLIGEIIDNKLIFSDDTEYYYKVKGVKIDGNIERTLSVIGRFTAIFTCEPFQFSEDDATEIIMGNTITRAALSLDPLQWYNFTGGTVYQNNVAVKANKNGPVTFNNPGTRKYKPVITIYGNGDVTITINDQTVYFTGLSEYVTIDSILEDVYKGTLLQSDQMQGNFPVLEPGDNSIIWTGNIVRIEIQCNSAWL